MRQASPRSPLDRPLARLAAVLVALAAAGGLLGMHWDDLFPPEEPVDRQGSAAYRACLDARLDDIAAMRERGEIEAARAARFRRRAEAYCRVQADGGGGGGGPVLPDGGGLPEQGPVRPVD